jgi:4-amino-4-deoxy-L-arabinose transferase-like glycosyltransferase
VLRTPGYPLLLAPLFWIYGDNPPVIAARVWNAAWGTLAVAIVGWWTTKLFDGRAGHLAGWIAAVYPGAIGMSAFVLSEAPFCAFMLLELALWGSAWRVGSSTRAAAIGVGGGVAAAAATLIRPSWLLFTPLAALVGLAVDRRRGRQLLVGAAVTGGLVVGMSPWWIRNAQVTGHFVATTLQLGASLYDGLNPKADGSSNMSFVDEFVVNERDERAAPHDEPFEYRLDRRMRHAALEWARDNPGRAVQLALVKFVRLWNVWPNEPSLRSWPLRLVVLATYAPLLCLGLVGVWRFTARGWPYLLAWLPAVYFTLLHMIFVSSIRYREPAMLALIVLASGIVVGAQREPAAPAGSIATV